MSDRAIVHVAKALVICRCHIVLIKGLTANKMQWDLPGKEIDHWESKTDQVEGLRQTLHNLTSLPIGRIYLPRQCQAYLSDGITTFIDCYPCQPVHDFSDLPPLSELARWFRPNQRFTIEMGLCCRQVLDQIYH